MNEERWADIPGYEGYYQVSSLGRIRSATRLVKSPIANSDDMADRTVKGQIIKPDKAANGYLYVNLWKLGKKKRAVVHRLVAQAFVSNPEGKPCVNHKDYNRQNAAADNLEWVTHSENALYSSERMSAAHIGKSRKSGRLGEMYIRETPCGHYKLDICYLKYQKTFHTLQEAKKHREAIIGW